jgi:DNA (cytosine-5)-methyltransferase 1
MSKLKVLDLFSGIGGFSLGLERTGGFETVAFCEIEEFPRKVLAKHWPEVPQYEDVRKLTADILKRDGISVDDITGGFPCQDISIAGSQSGIGEGTRSGLFSEIIRLIGDIRPKYIILENVSNLLNGPSEQPGRWFGRVLSDLAKCGYDAEWENIPASTVGASHRRERVWIVAYPCREGREGRKQEARSICGKPCASSAFSSDGILHKTDERLRANAIRNFDGLPRGVDRLKGLGNAVVPQIPKLIGNAILAAERQAS